MVKTNKGNIEANKIVIATHYPIINSPGYYFMKMHQERSYVIALENCNNVNGMYIDYDKKGYLFRNYKGLLLLGGINQRSGENETGGSYDELRKVAKELYPESKEKYHWNADELTWDCPCHGSRFDYKGRLINSPAVKDILDN